ncbi:low affinity immunoglobulin gamma Fc region receptor II-c-like [Carassius auratus]|uniref:low affinity immunoglobulin gamma Fc region receptor II-c-like n=1 Tax=Carassius auratus TaxID=7957 RepID=UPI000E40AAAF|nr:low affinity immunoglobulin gamma Fc region receptor II-c-like [Carassius auratus]
MWKTKSHSNHYACSTCVQRRDSLRCDVYGGGVTSWRYYWYKEGLYSVFSDQQEHTFRSVTESDAGKYSCNGYIRSNGSHRSDTVTLTVSDFPKPTLTVEPQSSVFTGDSVTLRCEGIQSQYGWDFLWRKDSNTETIEAATKTINRVKVSDRGEYSCRARRRECYYSIASDTGVYWCESESGEKHHAVNITVHSGVILESPVHPLTEGDNLILRCLYQLKTPSYLIADFYKDGSLIQNQTTEMSITTVSKSHQGFYYCKHPRGESPKSWISVRDSRSDGLNPMIIGGTAGLTVAVLIIVFLVLLWCYRNNKDSLSGPPEHIYDGIEMISVIKQKKKKEDEDSLSGPPEHIYANSELIPVTKQKKKKEDKDSLSGPPQHIYANIELIPVTKQRKKKEDEDGVNGPPEHIYDRIELKSVIKQKKKKEDKGAESSHGTLEKKRRKTGMFLGFYNDF